MPYARPVQVANNFFGKDGTVVVAAKKSMVNPFEMIFGKNDSKSKRNKVCEYYHLGWCNAKTFMKRINMFGLSIDDIKGVIE